jgi:hypothetical protein
MGAKCPEKHSQAVGYELSGLGAIFVVKKQGCLSQVFQHVKDVQHEEGCGEIGINQRPELGGAQVFQAWSSRED